MLPLSTFNSVKERGSDGALRSQLSLVRQGTNPRGGSRRSLATGMPSSIGVL